MFNIFDLKDFKINKNRITLPKNNEKSSIGNIVILNTKIIDDSISFILNPHINKLNIYNHIYMDNKYKFRLHGKSINKILTKERLDYYKRFDAEAKMSTVLSIKSDNERNLYYDISKYNELFFANTDEVNYKIKYTMYIDLLKTIIQQESVQEFPVKIMVLQFQDWVTDKIDSTNSRFNNPINLLLISMKKDINKFKELGDIEIILLDNNTTIKFNPKRCDDKSFESLKREISKLNHKNSIIDTNEVEPPKLAVEEPEVTDSSKMKPKPEAVDAIKKEFGEEADNDEVVDAIDKVGKRVGAEQEDVTDIINDEEVIQAIAKTMNAPIPLNRETALSKRDLMLRENQKKLKLSGTKTLEDLRVLKASNVKIPTNDISSKVDITNPNAKVVKFSNFERVYNDELYEKDISSVVTFLNNKSIPVHIRDVKVDDSSDYLNLKKTYTFSLEDSKRNRHTIKVDLPVFIDDKFCYLNGNRKIFNKQEFFYPLVKTGPDTVQVCSNYNKIFIVRYGENVEDKFERFKAWVRTDNKSFSCKKGNNSQINKGVVTTIEYDTLAKNFTEIKVKSDDGKKVLMQFIFNQNIVRETGIGYGLKPDQFIDNLADNELCVGFEFFSTKKGDPLPMIIDTDTQSFKENYGVPIINNAEDVDGVENMDRAGIIDYILCIKKGVIDLTEFNNYRVGKRFMYTRCTIMKKKIPLVILLSYVEGLSAVLRKAGINHYFSDKRVNLQDLDKINKGVIQFADGYLIYDKYPLENSLLLNGLSTFPVKNYEYAEFDEKNVYLDIFDALYGSRILANALDNFYEFMIDPVTLGILDDLNYPTEFVPLLIMGNKLLADNNYKEEMNTTISRVRSNEMVYAYLYKAVADAYIKYRLTSENRNPVKISIPRDVVLKNVLMSEIVEDYSELNPIVELEKSRAITAKGPSGVNLEQAYTQKRRSFDDSMIGVMSMSTSPDANCGVVRELTLEPQITNARGYIDNSIKTKDQKDVNLFSAAELLTPMGVTRDDSIRK